MSAMKIWFNWKFAKMFCFSWLDTTWHKVIRYALFIDFYVCIRLKPWLEIISFIPGMSWYLFLDTSSVHLGTWARWNINQNCLALRSRNQFRKILQVWLWFNGAKLASLPILLPPGIWLEKSRCASCPYLVG